MHTVPYTDYHSTPQFTELDPLDQGRQLLERSATIHALSRFGLQAATDDSQLLELYLVTDENDVPRILTDAAEAVTPPETNVVIDRLQIIKNAAKGMLFVRINTYPVDAQFLFPRQKTPCF